MAKEFPHVWDAPRVAATAGAKPEVYVVIPVFNRLTFTLACLNGLHEQTFAPLHVIVVDGGSDDGTPEVVRRHFPHVVLLQDERPLWWGGAMQLGIDYCLRQSRDDHGMLLMMNNDTVIERHYVETLVRVSSEHDAAVCGVIVDSRDPTRVLDAGEFVDWDTYSFPVNTSIDPRNGPLIEVDLLSGRGTLVPLSMIRAAGNVRGERFPHYISDCEFFARLKRYGFRLGVTSEVAIRSHVEATGLHTLKAAKLTLSQAWNALFSIKSMDNVRDHWRFIEDCAPAGVRARLKRQLIHRSVYLVLSRTFLRHVVLPVAWAVAGTYYVTRQDCAETGCDAEALVAAGILKPWRRPDWYVFEHQTRTRLHGRALRALYRRAWNPATKLPRWFKAKSRSKDGDRGAENAILS
jgi:GT2 family glycosyltransferase